jgi:hypothetical protein
MSSKRRKRKLKKPRNMVVLGMILARKKGGAMKDRRLRRKLESERKAITDHDDEVTQ